MADPLLAIQELDLAADALRKKRETLPERDALQRCQKDLQTIEGVLGTAQARSQEISQSEEKIGAAVSKLAEESKKAELELYSGSRKGRDAVAEHEQAQEERKAKQAELEEQEMALLEEIEGVEETIEKHTALRGENRERSAQLQAAIAKAEAEVDAELAELAGKKQIESESVDATLLAAYEQARTKPRLAGRGAAKLVDGTCGVCRVTLPVMENKRLLEAAASAVIFCPNCKRVMVR